MARRNGSLAAAVSLVTPVTSLGDSKPADISTTRTHDRENLPQDRRWGRHLLGHSPDARCSETPCQPFRKPRTSLSLYRR
jgi:hypothetical protein